MSEKRELKIDCNGIHVIAHIVPEGIFDTSLSEYSGSGEFFDMFAESVLSVHHVCTGIDTTKKQYTVSISGGVKDEEFILRESLDTNPIVSTDMREIGVSESRSLDAGSLKVDIPANSVVFAVRRNYINGCLRGHLNTSQGEEFDYNLLKIVVSNIDADLFVAFKENDLLMDAEGHLVSQDIRTFEYDGVQNPLVLEYKEYEESFSAYHRYDGVSWELDHMVEHSIE